jgi:hypothetical protein
MTTTDPSVPGYALPNHCELAEQRLALLEACHDGASIRRAEALGVAPGWPPRRGAAAGRRPARREDDIHPTLATATGDDRAAWLAFLAMMRGGRAGAAPDVVDRGR